MCVSATSRLTSIAFGSIVDARMRRNCCPRSIGHKRGALPRQIIHPEARGAWVPRLRPLVQHPAKTKRSITGNRLTLEKWAHAPKNRQQRPCASRQSIGHTRDNVITAHKRQFLHSFQTESSQNPWSVTASRQGSRDLVVVSGCEFRRRPAAYFISRKNASAVGVNP